jgi:hypothetical protein
MPRRTLPVKAAAVAAVLAALSVGGVAAAAGLLPGPARQTSASTAGDRATHAQGDAAVMISGRNLQATTSTASAPDKSSGGAVGPDASGAARDGLCRAWLAGQGDDHGRRADSRAFQALAAAAGGAGQIAAYCQADPGASATHGRRPDAPPSSRPVRSSPPVTGPPASPGNGHGQGGPPTTTG